MAPWQEFVAQLVASLAWPTSLVLAAIVFRKPVLRLLENLNEVSYGGVRASFDRQAADLTDSVVPNAVSKGITPELDEKLLRLAEASPRGAVIESWLRIERLLVRALDKKGIAHQSLLGRRLIDFANQNEVLGVGMEKSLTGLLQLRNLASHGPSSEIGSARAKEFLVIAEVNEHLLAQHNELSREQ